MSTEKQPELPKGIDPMEFYQSGLEVNKKLRENQPEWEKEYKQLLAGYFGEHPDLSFLYYDDIKSFIRSFASQLLDEIKLEKIESAELPEGALSLMTKEDVEKLMMEAYRFAKQELDQQKAAVKSKYEL
ncbi:MAG: hypothetical protein ACLGJB_17735 [Blastocatellia bacterium]